jgi:hypothetical protein
MAFNYRPVQRQPEHEEKPVNLRGLTVVDLLEPTRRGRITTIDNAGYIVTVQWAVADVQRVNVTDPRFVVEVPLREAARTCASP